MYTKKDFQEELAHRQLWPFDSHEELVFKMDGIPLNVDLYSYLASRLFNIDYNKFLDDEANPTSPVSKLRVVIKDYIWSYINLRCEPTTNLFGQLLLLLKKFKGEMK